MPQLCAWLCSVSLVLAAAGAVPGEEIRWRHDYNAARKEAADQHRLLMIDFGTNNCFWCKRLDLSTFQDARVVALVNQHFVPLKIDAEQETQLTRALNIQSYPTIVFGGSDGKIVRTVVGFKEADEFLQILQAVAAAAPSEQMVRDHQEAARAIANSDYPRAIALLKGMLEDGKDRPVQQKARQLLQEIEQQAAGRLARARQLEEKGQSLAAIDALTELLRVYPGTQSAQEATRLLNGLASKPDVNQGQRSRRARELLAQAREDYRTEQYLCCLDRCELLAANYADLDEANEAVQLASEIKNNPQWMQAACDSLSERLGLLYLALAETWIRKGQLEQAAACLERTIQSCPGTRQAEAAQIRLSYLRGQPTWQVEYKQP